MDKIKHYGLKVGGKMILEKSFYKQGALDLAKDLLGKTLVKR